MDPEFFERLIADGEIDFILMNRPLSVEPEYLAKQLEVAGVNVVTDQEVDASFISEQAPDAVVLAVGAARDTLGLSGGNGTSIVSIDDFLTADVADDVVVVGSNAQAIDAVMYLMAQGKHVQVVTPSPASAIGAGHSYWVKTYTQPLIKALGTRFWPQAEVLDVNDGSVTVKTDAGTEVELPCGTLIEALDGLPNTDLAQGLSMDVYPVGDCANPFNIGEAICTANAAARTI